MFKTKRFSSIAAYSGVSTPSFSAWDPTQVSASITLSNTNLTAKQTANGGTLQTVLGTASDTSGKFYFEITVDTLTATNQAIGLAVTGQGLNGDFLGHSTFSIGWYQYGAVLFSSGTVATIQTFAQGDNISMAADLTNNVIWFRTGSGNWNNSGTANPATNTGGISLSLNAGPRHPGVTTTALNDQLTANFGATSYVQTAPSGFGNW